MAILGIYSSDGTGSNDSWLVDLVAPGSGQMQYIQKAIMDRGKSTFFNRLPAQDIIVGNAGDNDLRVAASMDSSGKWIMVYTPTGQPFKTNTSSLNSCQVKAKWYYPTTGEYTTFVYSQCESNGASRKFTPPTVDGHADWVLVLEVSG
jgi:hypothetical protein